MSPRQPQDGTLLRLAIDSDPQPCKIAQENTSVRLGDPLATFVHHEDIADLKPSQTGDDRFFGLDSDVCGIGSGVLLILKRPARWNRRIEHEGHQYFRPSSRADRSSSKVTFAGPLSKFADTCQRSVDFFLPSIHLRHYPGDGAAVSGDDERLTALHIVEQLR